MFGQFFLVILLHKSATCSSFCPLLQGARHSSFILYLLRATRLHYINNSSPYDLWEIGHLFEHSLRISLSQELTYLSKNLHVYIDYTFVLIHFAYLISCLHAWLANKISVIPLKSVFSLPFSLQFFTIHTCINIVRN